MWYCDWLHNRTTASISKHSGILLGKVGKLNLMGRGRTERQRMSLLEKEGPCYSLRIVLRAQATTKVTAAIAGEGLAPDLLAGFHCQCSFRSDLQLASVSKPSLCIKCPDNT